MLLRALYTMFFGLILAIFVGVTIATFYEEPAAPEYPATMTSIKFESEEWKQQDIIYQQKFQEYNKVISVYNRNVSAIVMSLAVVLLIIGMSLSEKLGVFSDGILLSAVFCMLYGMGRGFASGDVNYKFIVSLIGLIVAIIVGYKKFIPKNT